MTGETEMHNRRKEDQPKLENQRHRRGRNYLNHAFIEAPGDPTVGIFPTLVCIDDIGFDLGCLAEEDQEAVKNEFREKLKDAFEIAWGERPSVWFHAQIDALREHQQYTVCDDNCPYLDVVPPAPAKVISDLQARIEELEEEMRELEKEYKNMAAWLDEERIKVAELKEKLKTAEKWDDIESSRNEQLNARIKRLDAALADLWDYVENMESEHNTPHVGLFMSTKPEHRETIEEATRKARAGE